MSAASLTLDLSADAEMVAVRCERPTSINLADSDKPPSMQQSQLSNPTTPTSATLSPSGSATSISPSSASFLPEMPQWKKDLIQRRKTNSSRSGVVCAGGVGGGTVSPLPSPQQHRFGFGCAGDATSTFAEKDGFLHSFKTTSTVQHQKQLQQHSTAEELHLQQQTTKTIAINAIKTPTATTTHTHSPQTPTPTQQRQYNEEDPVTISPTAKEETAEKFIGGHSTPQVSSSGSGSGSVDLNNIVKPSTTNNAAPIPKQRSLFVASTKQLSAEEADSCTNSFATASQSSSSSPSFTRLTSLSSPTYTKQEQLRLQQQQQQHTTNKSRIDKKVPRETDQKLHEAAAPTATIKKDLIEETSTVTKSHNKHTLIANKCGTYSSSSSTSTCTHSQFPISTVGKSTIATATTTTTTSAGTTVVAPIAAGSSLPQSHSSNASDRSSFTVTTGFGNSVLLPSPTTATAPIQTTVTTNSNQLKSLDIEKFDKPTKISTKLQSNQFIKNQAAAVGGISAKYLKHKSAASTAQEQSQAASFGAAPSAPGSTTNSNVTAKSTVTAAGKKKMVAVQEMKKTGTNHHIIGGTSAAATATTCGRQQQRAASSAADAASHFDPGEDLSYGPGIVSKLRCRYLSLALRESMDKQRHALDTLRRATSLNNLLDRDDQRKRVDDDEEEEEDGCGGNQLEVVGCYGEDQENLPPRPVAGGILRTHEQQQQNVVKKTATFQKYAAAATANTCMSQSQSNSSAPGENNLRSRHVKRGNDSLKRARSVEALLCEKSPWNFVYNRSSLDPAKVPPPTASNRSCIVNVTIEDKINNARERLVLGTDITPPRRLTSIIDDTERPPPDLVKQTLKKFEATANRRSRGLGRSQGNGDVANKVANYRSIIKEQKPPIVFPKPQLAPQSPTKKAAVKIAAKLPGAVATADVVGPCIERKSNSTAAVSNNCGSLIGFQSVSTETSTPKKRYPLPPSVAAELTPVLRVAATPNFASPPDVIARSNSKLPCEAEAEAGGDHVVVDSPVTALTKKLHKLRLDATTATGSVIAKESQTKPNQQQQQASGDTESSAQVRAIDSSADDAARLLDKVSPVDKNSSNSNDNGTRSHKNKSNDDDENTDDDKKTTNEHSDDDDDDRRDCVEAESATAETRSASSDFIDDECGPTTKRVSKAALENIAKAGTSQQFKFAGSQKAAAAATETPAPVTGPSKQIGIIRPLPNHGASNDSFATAKSQTSNGGHQRLMDTLNHNQQSALYNASHSNIHFTTTNTHAHAHTHQSPVLTSREIEKNRINEIKKTATVAFDATSQYAATSAAAASAAAAATSAAATTSSLDTVIITAGSSSNNKVSGLSELDAATTIQNNSSPLWAMQTKKKRQPPIAAAENNTMVFNFSNRKEVPDYIENDGVVIRRKRELPKPNESGFVLLGDLSLETSTDSDYDDFSLCPPSPCDVEFENANVVIDGKSSIRQKSKEASFRVQFNDTLTSTFEYPSEASLIVDVSNTDRYGDENFANAYESLVLEPAINTSATATDSPKHHHHVAVDEIIPLPTTATAAPATTNSSPTANILGSLPLGSAPLGCYTPVKAPIDNLFQLGVTRAPNGTTLSSHNQTSAIAIKSRATNGTESVALNGSRCDGKGSGEDGNESESRTAGNSTCDEPESLQYLKPANDDLTIAYSEGAQETDLLY